MKKNKVNYQYLSPWTYHFKRNKRWIKRRSVLDVRREEYLKELNKKLKDLLNKLYEKEREKSRSKINFNNSLYKNINKIDCQYKQYRLIRNNIYNKKIIKFKKFISKKS